MQKQFRRWIGIALLTGALALFGAAEAQAALNAGGVARTTAELNLRKGAGTSYSVIVEIPKGRGLELIAKQDNGWWKVLYSGKTGYVSGSYLTENTSFKKTTAALRMRTSARTDITDNIIATIPKGTTVDVIAKYTNGWYRVMYSGKAGYVSGNYLTDTTAKTAASSQSGSTAATGTLQTTAPLNMRTSTQISGYTNVIVTIPQGKTVTLVSKESNGWYKVKYKDYTGYVSGKYLKAVSGTGTAAGTGTSTEAGTTKTMYEALNMRSSMSKSSNSNIIDVLPKGAKVTIVSKEDGGWYKVKYNGQTGYIMGGHFTDDTSRVSGGTSSGSGSSSEAGTTKTMYEALNMRSSMSKGSSSNIIDVLPKGAKVTIVSKEDGGWYKVKYNGQTGYIMGGHFTDDTSRVGKN